MIKYFSPICGKVIPSVFLLILMKGVLKMYLTKFVKPGHCISVYNVFS